MNNKELITQGRLLTLTVVMGMVPYKRTTLWKMWKAGNFPQPVKVGPNRIAFYEDEIIQWIEHFRQAKIDPPVPSGYHDKYEILTEDILPVGVQNASHVKNRGSV